MLKKVKLPLTEESIKDLHAGDNVLLSGIMYVARDAAHKRLVEALDKGQSLPFDIKGQTIYYMGPSPAKPGQVIGSAGPTTSGRMDSYSPRLMEVGLKGMIGKGNRTKAVIAFEELGAEAIRKLEVEDFPVTVINDIYGRDLYEEGKAKYRIAVK
jgi:fumarate hydratase subunit beta